MNRLALFLCIIPLVFRSLPSHGGRGEELIPGATEADGRVISLGVETWFTSGAGEWDISAWDYSGRGIRSVLEWKALDSTLVVLNAGWWLRPDIGLTAAVAGGDIEGGRNTDTDWRFGPGYDADGFVFSESMSNSEGDTSLFDLGIVLKCVSLQVNMDGGSAEVWLVLGYQEYEDSLVDRDGVQTVVDETPVYDLFSGENARYDFTWTAYRAGLRGEYSFGNGFTVSSEVLMLFGVIHDGEGFWLLRTDMWPYSPNMLNHAENGWGGDVRVDFSYQIGSRLTAYAGWHALYLQAEYGVHTTLAADGSLVEVSLDSVSSRRNGFVAGLRSCF